MVFEHLTVVVVPARNLHIKDVVVKFLDSFELVREHLPKLTQRYLPLFPLGSAKLWHAHIGSLEGKLELAFTNFLQISASLDEGFIFGKDGLVSIQLPIFLSRVHLNASLHLCANIFPLFTAFNRFI